MATVTWDTRAKMSKRSSYLSIIIGCLYFHFVNVAVAAAPDSLRIVNVLYRHGDRSPVSIYPTDPYQTDSWPQGLGWLSEIGMQQQFELGKFLRSEYGNLLNATYINSQIRVESSDEDRCLMSAYCNLAGLYPPTGSQVWNPNITWQPIPVHAVPKKEDNKVESDHPYLILAAPYFAGTGVVSGLSAEQDNEIWRFGQESRHQLKERQFFNCGPSS